MLRPKTAVAIFFAILTFAASAFSYSSLEPISEVTSPAGEYASDRFWKVAVVQWNPPGTANVSASSEEAEIYKDANRKLMAEKIREAAAQGARFIALSEFATIGYPDIPELPSADDNYRNRADIEPFVEPIPGPSTLYFSSLAKELGVWIQFGMAEVDLETTAYYNVAIAINDAGEIVAKYRKQNLYQIEPGYISRGTENIVYKTPAGLFGILICSDVYYYPALENYKNAKVDALILSTSWAEQNTGMGYFKSAARYANAYLLAANQNYFPDSGVIDPGGNTQSHIRQTRNAIAYGYLPLKTSAE